MKYRLYALFPFMIITASSRADYSYTFYNTTPEKVSLYFTAHNPEAWGRMESCIKALRGQEINPHEIKEITIPEVCTDAALTGEIIASIITYNEYKGKQYISRKSETSIKLEKGNTSLILYDQPREGMPTALGVSYIPSHILQKLCPSPQL